MTRCRPSALITPFCYVLAVIASASADGGWVEAVVLYYDVETGGSP